MWKIKLNTPLSSHSDHLRLRMGQYGRSGPSTSLTRSPQPARDLRRAALQIVVSIPQDGDDSDHPSTLLGCMRPK